MPVWHLGPLNLSLQTAAVAGSILVGLVVLWLQCRTHGLDAGLAVDAALAGLLVGVVAGRLEVIVANLEYFRERPLFAIDITQGGVGQRSLTLAAVAVYTAAVARRRYNWRAYLSVATPAAALAAALLWAAATFTGQAAGAPWHGPIAFELPDQYGLLAPRPPLQLGMAGLHLALAALSLVWLNRALPAGASLLAWGALAAAGSAVLGNLRAEAVLFIGVLPRPVAADMALAVVWLLAAIILPRAPNRAAKGAKGRG